MRLTPLLKGPLAVRFSISSHISAHASRGWRAPLWGRSMIRCTSSIQSGHISVGENQGIIYVNSERAVIRSYHVYPLIRSRHISAPTTMAAARTPQPYSASRGIFGTSQQSRTSGGPDSYSSTRFSQRTRSGDQRGRDKVQRGRRIREVCAQVGH